MITFLELRRTRFPVFKSCSCKLVASEVAKAGVLVVQTVIPTELVRMSFPSFKTESFEPVPSTGSSRFAIQTTVEFLDLLNHMAKQKALSPTGKNPAEYSPFAETNRFSIDRDVPPRVSLSNVLANCGRVCNRHRRRKKTEISMTNVRARLNEMFLLVKSSSFLFLI